MSNIKKYIKKKGVIITIIAMVLIIPVYLYYDWYYFDYRVTDYFSDSSSQGKMVFMFIEVEDYDKGNMIRTGKELIRNHPSALVQDKNKLLVMINHFYRRKEARPLPDSIKNDILQRYNYLRRIDKEVNYISRGYIYTAFSRKVKGVKIPQDSLFKASFIVPKPGVKARDVIKRSK